MLYKKTIITVTAVIEEIVLLNFNFLSKKFAKGSNKKAINSEKNNGDNKVLPITAKYPNIMMDKSTKASLATKGKEIDFIL
jgi:hypothetical protein